jgi:heptose-I-phosphate ethanolaminephosphotransferase
MIGNPYARKQRPLIDFSLMKPKGAPITPEVVQQ